MKKAAAIVGVRPFTLAWHDQEYKITELVSAEQHGQAGVMSYSVNVRNGNKQFELFCDQHSANTLLI